MKTKKEILQAIEYLEHKIAKQGIVANARDEEHLNNLKQLLK